MSLTQPTASTISVGYKGNVGVATLLGQDDESTRAVNECLQENHDKHHIFFNQDNFHNHIVHHLLALYSLGANHTNIQKAYEKNKSYQRPLDLPSAPKDTHIPPFEEWESSGLLGKQKYYADFLKFFVGEIEKDPNGWEGVLQRFLFNGSVEAENMLEKLVAGFLHPFIHLGYGIEHEQPAIIAEALAQTAVHDDWPAGFLRGCSAVEEPKTPRTFLSLLQECAENEKLKNSAKFSDGQKNKGVMKREGPEMIRVAGQWRVAESEIESKMKEIVEGTAILCGAAIRPDKAIKFDFFLMHSLNASTLLSAYLASPALTTASKAKLLTTMGRMNLNMYVSRGCPKLYPDEISGYTPKNTPLANPWLGVVDRGLRFGDDGHTVKFIRACYNGERVMRGDGEVMARGMWSKLAAMVIDSVEETKGGEESEWVRSTGFEEAWKGVGERKVYGGKSEARL